MGTLLASLMGGLLFGLGLAVSGMTEPQRVLGFLDVAGRWDPTLALVMAGALAVTAIAFPIVQRRGRTVLSGTLHLPTRRDIDARLVAGSALFGVGWGLAGFCPGPALAMLAAPQAEVLVFVLAMVAGMLAARGVLRASAARAAEAGAHGAR